MANLRARWLRNNMTPQEVKLWVQLKHLNRNGHHFRRQVPIAPFIVDFAKKSSRLVIEVDGSQHGEDVHQLKDSSRDNSLDKLGYRVLRFWNIDVDTNMDGVIDTITNELNRKSQ
jgi:very-short-patch-repair endonuclease